MSFKVKEPPIRQKFDNSLMYLAKNRMGEVQVVRLNGYQPERVSVHDLENIISALEEAKSRAFQGKPIMILMKTNMGHGVDFMMGSHKWHGVAPNDEQLKQALDQLSSTLQDY